MAVSRCERTSQPRGEAIGAREGTITFKSDIVNVGRVHSLRMDLKWGQVIISELHCKAVIVSLHSCISKR